MPNSIFLFPGVGSVTPGPGGGTTLIAPLTLNVDGLAALSPPTAALILANDTPATAGVPVQESPSLRLRANVWNSTTPANNTSEWFIYNYPLTGATPSSELYFGYINNGGSASFPFKFTSGGSFYLQGIGQSLVLPAAGYFGFSGQSYFSSLSNGTLRLSNSAVTIGVNFDFTVADTLKVRNFANNADAAITASTGTFSAWLSVGVGQQLYLGGGNKIALNSPLDGQLVIQNNGNTAGIGLDVTVDNIGAFRNRAQNANAAIRASFYGSTASTVLTISSNVITPVSAVHHLGAGLVKTITVPATIQFTGTITIIPDAAYTYDATGNIVVPAGGGTALIGKVMTFTWDSVAAKWYPSY